MNSVGFAFLLTLLAGLSTGIGSVIAFFSRHQNPRYLSVLLGFSAGVMIYVSMIELFPQAQEALTADLGQKTGAWATAASFFGGIAVIAIIDKLVPSEANPHEFANATGLDTDAQHKLYRMGLFTAVAIAIHNFPEGFATFISGLQAPEVAIPIAVAIALHNIPEGIAVSAPIYYATQSRKKAFWLSFGSGLAEPLGAVIGYLILRPFLSDTVFGIAFAGVAGIMVYISLDELLPSAEEYGEHHFAIGGLIAGMAVMALSLLLLM
ncbi:zinc transporter ZupT [Ancrocorticia populi]|uniref:zinc transporter ZupT n=1 Tax=Ancrocorticia populi TaxID=2175228 RepID=UPI002357691D|nr:zinc transporter ZupT [Ancrocorticia populi]